MKGMTLKLGEKTYMAARITAYAAKEAMRINRDAVELGKLGNDLKENKTDLDNAGQLLEALLELSERKTSLVCEVYGNKFDAEELEKSLSPQEIDMEINKIILGISGIISKN